MYWVARMVLGILVYSLGLPAEGPTSPPAHKLESPAYLAVDSKGNLLISDPNQNLIFRLDPAGRLAVVAGDGTRGFGGDGGPATQAKFSRIGGIALDQAGNLFIADRGNHRVRRVDRETGIITTVAGNGTRGFSGEGGPATSASLSSPSALAIDEEGNLYISDYSNRRVRRVNARTGTITTVAGNGEFDFLNARGREFGDEGRHATEAPVLPNSLAVDSKGSLFIAESASHRIHRLDQPNGTITTVAGNGNYCFDGGGVPARRASVGTPRVIALDGAGNLFIADSFNHRVRRVDAATGIITTVAGNGTKGFSGDGGPSVRASLANPLGLAVDQEGNFYIADLWNKRVRRVDAATGIITTVAGSENPPFKGDPDAAEITEKIPVVPYFRDQSQYVNRFRIQEQKRISKDYSAVVVYAYVPSEEVGCLPKKLEYREKEAYGVFIQSNTDRDHILALDVFPSPAGRDGIVKIEEVDERTLIVSKRQDTYGYDFGRVKYFYDLDAAKLLKKFEYQPMNVYDAARLGNELFFLGSDDRERSIIAKLTHSSAYSSPEYVMITSLDSQPIKPILAIEKEGKTLVFLVRKRDPIEKGEDYGYSEGKWTRVPYRFISEAKTVEIRSQGPIHRRLRIEKGDPPGPGREKLSGIRVVSRGESDSASQGASTVREEFYPLPQPTYDLFQAYRPRRVENGYTRGGTVFQEDIGPFQLEENKLWFGMTFYDGEGYSGVGGLGTFDVNTSQYEVRYLREIADWSVQSILVEEEAIWMGLAGRGEGSTSSGGVARYDRATGTVKKYKVPAVINKILRAGDALYLATTNGIYLVLVQNDKGYKLVHLEYTLNIDGSYSLRSKLFRLLIHDL